MMTKRRRLIKVAVSMMLALTMLAAWCLPTFAAEQALYATNHIRYSFDVPNNAEYTATVMTEITGSYATSATASLVVDILDNEHPFIYLTWLDGSISMDIYASNTTYPQQVASFNDAVMGNGSAVAVTNIVNIPADGALTAISDICAVYEDRNRNGLDKIPLFSYIGTYLDEDLLTDTYMDDY